MNNIRHYTKKIVDELDSTISCREITTHLEKLVRPLINALPLHLQWRVTLTYNFTLMDLFSNIWVFSCNGEQITFSDFTSSNIMLPWTAKYWNATHTLPHPSIFKFLPSKWKDCFSFTLVRYGQKKCPKATTITYVLKTSKTVQHFSIFPFCSSSHFDISFLVTIFSFFTLIIAYLKMTN